MATINQKHLVHRTSPFGPWSEVRYESRSRKNGEILLILEGDLVDQDLPRVATEIRRRRVRPARGVPRLNWVFKSSDDSRSPQYQALRLDWDGERYTTVDRGPVFNEAAFTSAFD